MAATATAGAGGHFKVDTDAMQSAIKTWDQVIEELQQCFSMGQGLSQVPTPANDPASNSMVHSANQSGHTYVQHVQDLLVAAQKEQKKLQDAVTAYQTNDAGGASTAKHVQGNA